MVLCTSGVREVQAGYGSPESGNITRIKVLPQIGGYNVSPSEAKGGPLYGDKEIGRRKIC